jgi:hypothetical protein
VTRVAGSAMVVCRACLVISERGGVSVAHDTLE